MKAGKAIRGEQVEVKSYTGATQIVQREGEREEDIEKILHRRYM